MSVVVTKFGGSSLADAGQIKKMEEIVRSDENRCFVVPSAPGKRFFDDIKVTDMLYVLYEEQDPASSKTFGALKERFGGICSDLGVKVDIMAELDKIAEDLKHGESVDYAASRGEYLNGLIIADLLGFDFIDPKDFICFDDKGFYDHNATVDKFKPELRKHSNAVVPGFYGSMPDGKIKTFSRGGSDITGSIVACCAEASMYENWTDVDGFLKADPRIVDNPEKIDVITYRELRELSYMGATVLHEDSIFPVLQVAIPIHVRNTNDPEGAGTLIVPQMTPELEKKAATITGIAGKKDFTVIAIAKNGMNSEVGFGRRVLNCLEKYGITFEHMPSSIDAYEATRLEYRMQGLERNEAFPEPDDHLAVQLAFVSWLCTPIEHAAQSGDAGALEAAFSEQLRFIDNHLLNWLDRFCAELLIAAQSAACDREEGDDSPERFYMHLAKFTILFLRFDRASVADLLS